MTITITERRGASCLELGLLGGGGAGDVGLDQSVRLIDGEENVWLSRAVLVRDATLLLQGEGKVVDVRHGQVDLEGEERN